MKYKFVPGEFLEKSINVHDHTTQLEYLLLIKVAHSRITRATKGTTK